jgi:predicted transcriptional regulator
MRTTLTLDDDVAAAIQRLRKSRRVTLSKIVNEALREGIKQMGANSKRDEPFRTQTAALGRLRVGSIDDVAEVLLLAERESVR